MSFTIKPTYKYVPPPIVEKKEGDDTEGDAIEGDTGNDATVTVRPTQVRSGSVNGLAVRRTASSASADYF